MKYLGIILLFFVVGIPTAAQTTCPSGLICFTQAQANDIDTKLKELAADRDVIAKFMVERATNAAELAKANKVIEGWQAIDATNTSIQQKYAAVISMYEHVVQMQADLIEKLIAKVNAPKSAWQKFLTAAKEVLILAAGITLGRGL